MKVGDLHDCTICSLDRTSMKSFTTSLIETRSRLSLRIPCTRPSLPDRGRQAHGSGSCSAQENTIHYTSQSEEDCRSLQLLKILQLK